MNKIELKKKAIDLKEILSKYSKYDAEAESLLFGLLPFIDDAIAEKIDKPVRRADMPGAYFFNEGQLRQYSDLESAYAEFKIEITGGETPALRMFREEDERKKGNKF